MSDSVGRLQAQAWMLTAETQKLMRALLEDGGDARFVGGCVRDALVNRPVTDIDIATPLVPEKVIERLKRHNIPFAPTGLKHGTVTAIVDGRPFEITTLRLDIQTFGRHAEVKYTDDWKMDASRRDFTINAMSATIEGDIFDPFGGIEDLRRGRVRFVGAAENRIREDVLRILRFFRFTAHFGREEPDAEALKACTEAAKEITKLSPERLRQETLKLLESDRCAAVWRRMLSCGVVTHFLPEASNVAALENLVRLEAACSDIETGSDHKSFALRRLAAVLDVTEGGLKHVITALRLSNHQAEHLVKMVVQSGVKIADEISLKKTVYRFGNDMARSLLLLHAAKTGGEAGLAALFDLATTFRPPRFPLTGDDVLKLGVPAGPDVGLHLQAVESWWMDGHFSPGRAECLAFLRARFH